jgi:hypothetical protein
VVVEHQLRQWPRLATGGEAMFIHAALVCFVRMITNKVYRAHKNDLTAHG